MHDELPPQSNTFSTSRWIMSGFFTAAMIGGGLVVVFYLFMADGIVDVGQDPAIPAEVARVDARVTALEQKMQNMDTTTATSETTQAAPTQPPPNQAAQIALALTTLSDAYAHDQPLGPGITLLEQSIHNAALQPLIADLATLAKDKIPTQNELLADANQALGGGAQDNLMLAPQDNSILGRLRRFIGGFVKVQPTSAVAHRNAHQELLVALSRDDLGAANKLLSKLPNSPTVQSLAAKVQTRLKVQQTIQAIIGQIRGAISGNGGNNNRLGLY